MGTIKDRNGMDLTEAEDIKKGWQEYTDKLYKKTLMTRISMMMWSVTEREAKWALESNTFNKSSGDDGILAELFQILKDNAWMEEAQVGMKNAGRNINNFRYADETTLMEEREEELKSLLMRMKKERRKNWLKFNIQKTGWHPAPSLHSK